MLLLPQKVGFEIIKRFLCSHIVSIDNDESVKVEYIACK